MAPTLWNAGGVRRPAVLTALLVAALVGCGDDDPETVERDTAPRPAVQKRKKPVWCPAQRYEQVRRSDGRYDVKRVAHGTFDARRLLGLPQDDAERLAQRNDCSVRVVQRDDEKLATTEDLRPNRINVTVRRGYVTALKSVG
jgi:hypothetical protein